MPPDIAKATQMKLLASTDYALRILMLLAELKGEDKVSVDRLAQRLGGLSTNHLHKIVQNLTALGIVETSRGVGGGVRLAVAPELVVLGKVIRQLEADQSLVVCFNEADMACTLLPACRLRGLLAHAQNAFYAALETSTLADCIGKRGS
jgi:Rrf2 family transcriptional regulator, nitric oxide-sensitive transcriptional repressor